MADRTPGKAIVLLSDGTGNSAAKLMKTNVWRMYGALELTSGDQIALYDNGVGTSSFKLFAVLGGALGFGLKRNVRSLYTFACRNYVAASETRDADRLYAFGFSRGAFTIRVLHGLIADQGLITGVRGRDLDRLARQAYREYRRKFNSTGILVTPFRAIRDVALQLWGRWRRWPVYDTAEKLHAHVAFVGLWDTVDAYGLPIDEMTRGWDKWVWPLSMDEPRPGNADKICHAIALDDERHTFHPVLLDESRQPPATHTDHEVYTQVWFAGVHSNVGGGYPDDSLAHVSLRWMAEEAAKKGLRFHEAIRAQWDASADDHGPVYDSRRGLGSYYRYNPRSIQKLTNDRFADVDVPRPKIHESVFRRIAAGRDDYAPLVLPNRYAIVTRNGAILEGDTNPYEHPTQAASRCADQERVWNHVFLRRILYFATVAVTLALLVPPLIWTPEEVRLKIPSPQWRTGSGFVAQLGAFVPGSLQVLTDYYVENPVHFAVLAAVLFVLLFLSWRQRLQIQNLMRLIWHDTIHGGRREVTPHSPPGDFICRWRSSRSYRNVVQWTSQTAFPFVFGLLTLLLFALMVVGTINRAVFALNGVAGLVCEDWPAREVRQPDPDGVDVTFGNDEVCHASGVELVGGQTYRVKITLPPEGWSDRGWFGREHLARTPAGFSSADEGPLYLLALPFRRVFTVQWFVPVARIGMHAGEYHALDQPLLTITPRRTGQLFLFVNDDVPPWPFWADSYVGRNDGKRATVNITLAPAVSLASAAGGS